MKIPRKEKKQIKINTTALPDIIFMLLFFFMVTTVMQNQKSDEILLPSAHNLNSKTKVKNSDLEIYISNVADSIYLRVGALEGSFNHYQDILGEEIKTKLAARVHTDQAYLYIDENVSMSEVNKIKYELRTHNILKVKYIHDYKFKS